LGYPIFATKNTVMFSFFIKKEYLADHLSGFVDIHNHILPGIDDGAKTVKDSLNLIKGFEEVGVTNFICTPHIMHNYYDNNPKTIQKSYNLLQKACKEEHIDAQLSYAAEHMIDDNFEQLLAENQVIPLRRDHVLVEMSFLQPPINLNLAINRIRSKNYFAVLAHPERYLFYHDNFNSYHSLKAQDIQFQVNLLSLAGYYGNHVKNIAAKLMEKGLVDYLGSDVHNMGQLEFIKNAILTPKLLKKTNELIVNTIDQFHH